QGQKQDGDQRSDGLPSQLRPPRSTFGRGFKRRVRGGRLRGGARKSALCQHPEKQTHGNGPVVLAQERNATEPWDKSSEVRYQKTREEQEEKSPLRSFRPPAAVLKKHRREDQESATEQCSMKLPKVAQDLRGNQNDDGAAHGPASRYAPVKRG